MMAARKEIIFTMIGNFVIHMHLWTKARFFGDLI